MKLCCSPMSCGQSLPMLDDFGVCLADLGVRGSTALSIVLRRMAATLATKMRGDEWKDSNPQSRVRCGTVLVRPQKGRL